MLDSLHCKNKYRTSLRPVIRPVTVFDISKFLLALLTSSSLGEKKLKKLLSNQTNHFVFWVKFIFSRRGVVERWVKRWAVRHWDRQTEGGAAGADRDAGGHAERMAALTAISTLSSATALSSVFQHRLEVLHPSTARLTSRTANIYTGAAAPASSPSSVTAGGGQHAGTTNRAAIEAAHLSLSPLMSQRAAENRALPHSRTPSTTTQPPPASNNRLLVLTSPFAGSKYCGSLVWTQQRSPRTETAAMPGITALINK